MSTQGEGRASALMDAYSDARTEQYNLECAGKLLWILGEDIGENYAGRTDLDWQKAGLITQYLADQMARHISALDKALEVVETALYRAERSATPSPLHAVASGGDAA